MQSGRNADVAIPDRQQAIVQAYANTAYRSRHGTVPARSHTARRSPLSAPIAHVSWRPGDVALLRYRRLGPVSVALPVTVVADTAHHTMLYLRSGTPIRRRVMPDGTLIPRTMGVAERSRLPHLVGHGTWVNHALIISPPGAAHDLRLFWDDDWVFLGWYVNLQAPLRHVAVGFDTADHQLDIVIAPDGGWSWKDEDELADAVALGHFSPEKAARIRAEGERVIPAIESRAWPFDGSLINWRPDPAWPMPTVPVDWNTD